MDTLFSKDTHYSYFIQLYSCILDTNSHYCETLCVCLRLTYLCPCLFPRLHFSSPGVLVRLSALEKQVSKEAYSLTSYIIIMHFPSFCYHDEVPLVCLIPFSCCWWWLSWSCDLTVCGYVKLFPFLLLQLRNSLFCALPQCVQRTEIPYLQKYLLTLQHPFSYAQASFF